MMCTIIIFNLFYIIPNNNVDQFKNDLKIF